jgi:O-antigen/teichoic acid export membrane protein
VEVDGPTPCDYGWSAILWCRIHWGRRYRRSDARRYGRRVLVASDPGGHPPNAASVARTGSLNLLARLTGGVALLALAILTTNVLDTQGRGVYAILATCAGIAATVLGGASVVIAADLIHGRRDRSASHGVATALAMASFAAMVPLALCVAVVADEPVAGLVSAALVAVLATYAEFEMAIAQAEGNVKRVSLTDIGMAVFPLVVSVLVAVLLDATATTLITAWAVGAGITAAMLVVSRIPATLPLARHVWREAMRIPRRAGSVSFANAVSLLCSRIDVLIVAAVVSTSAAGVYSIPVALAANLLLLPRSLLTATYRSIMTAPDAGVARRLGAALRHSVIVVLVAGALSLPFVAALGGPVFGDAYADIWQPYALLVLASACHCVVEILRHFLLTRWERRREFVLVITGMLVLNAALTAVGAAAFGLVGAAGAVVVTYGGAGLVLVAFCARELAVPMRELSMPRRSDLVLYWVLGRSALHRARRQGA